MGWEFFVPGGTLIAVKLLIIILGIADALKIE